MVIRDLFGIEQIAEAGLQVTRGREKGGGRGGLRRFGLQRRAYGHRRYGSLGLPGSVPASEYEVFLKIE